MSYEHETQQLCVVLCTKKTILLQKLNFKEDKDR